MTMIPYKLRDWIPECYVCLLALSNNPRAIRLLEKNQDKINWQALSFIPEAIHLLEKNQDKIDWRALSSNPAAIHLLEKNPDKIDWYRLSSNPAAIQFLEKNPDKIVWHSLAINTNPDAMILFEKNYFKLMFYEWHGLCKNPHAMPFIESEWRATQIIDWFYKWFCCCTFRTSCKIKWKSLCLNTNPSAISLLEKNPDKIHWDYLSRNPAAIRLIKENLEKICWSSLSFNTDPGAIHLLENEIRTNPHNSIHWNVLSQNSGAIHILEKYPNRFSMFCLVGNTNPEAMRLIESYCKTRHYIPWFELLKNPNIFTYDYDQMKESKIRLHEELIRNMFHPLNMEKFDGWGFDNGFVPIEN